MDTTTRLLIEALRNYYNSTGNITRAHLCTAALTGEQWAIDRITDLAGELECDRPDGATPRSL